MAILKNEIMIIFVFALTVLTDNTESNTSDGNTHNFTALKSIIIDEQTKEKINIWINETGNYTATEHAVDYNRQREANSIFGSNTIRSLNNQKTGPGMEFILSKYGEDNPKNCVTAFDECQSDEVCKEIIKMIEEDCVKNCDNINRCKYLLHNLHIQVPPQYLQALEDCTCTMYSGNDDSYQCAKIQNIINPTCLLKPLTPEAHSCLFLQDICPISYSSCDYRLHRFKNACAYDLETKSCAGSFKQLCHNAIIHLQAESQNCICEFLTYNEAISDCQNAKYSDIEENPCVRRILYDSQQYSSPYTIPTPLNRSEDYTTTTTTTETTITEETTPETTTKITTTTVMATTKTEKIPVIPKQFAPGMYAFAYDNDMDVLQDKAGCWIYDNTRRILIFIELHLRARIFTKDDCSEVYGCFKNRNYTGRTVCMTSSDNRRCANENIAHLGFTFSETKGSCVCYTENLLCALPDQEINEPKHGIFLYIAYSMSDAQTVHLNPNFEVQQNDILESFEKYIVWMQSKTCKLHRVLDDGMHLAYIGKHMNSTYVSVDKESYKLVIKEPSLEEYKKDKIACKEFLVLLKVMINDGYNEFRNVLDISVIKVAEVRTIEPEIPNYGGKLIISARLLIFFEALVILFIVL